VEKCKKSWFLISGFLHKVDESCTLLGYYPVSSGNSIPKLRDNLSALSSKVKNSKRKPVTPVYVLYREECRQ